MKEAHIYPQFFEDNVAFFVRNEDELMTPTDLYTLLTHNIWMSLCVCVMLVNCSFLLIYYHNPKLQRSVKVRTKAMSKMINVISLHGLTFFQSEWQQGPTVSSKWILFTYNILFFIFSTIYITLYTQKIFSLKKLTPFDVHDIPNSAFIYSGAEFIEYMLVAHCPRNSGRIFIDGSKNDFYENSSVDILFEKLQNGNKSAVVEVEAIALKEIKYFPAIGIVSDAVVKYPFSFRSNFDFDFLEIFDKITLKMREVGVINKLINTHFDLKYIAEPILSPVMFALVWYLLVILGIGIGISVIVCLIEKFIWKLN